MNYLLKSTENLQNPKSAWTELVNLMPYVHKHFKHKFLFERAIPLHSHYQVLVGEAVALSVSCWCRLSQLHGARWGNWPRSNQLSETFQVSINYITSPKPLGLRQKKRKKNWGIGSCGEEKAGLLHAAALQHWAFATARAIQAGYQLPLVPFLITHFLFTTSQASQYHL